LTESSIDENNAFCFAGEISASITSIVNREREDALQYLDPLQRLKIAITATASVNQSDATVICVRDARVLGPTLPSR